MSQIGNIFKKLFLLFAGVLCFSSKTFAQDKFISYTDVGQGQPLVLIHAFPADKVLWASQQDQLKQHFRVITLDLWGFGQSASVDGQAVTMTDYADEVRQVLDQLHIQKAIIGGESMGGYVTLAFLKKYPDSVSGLVLSDTQSIADSADTKAKREATAVDILANGTAQYIQTLMPKLLSPAASDQTKATLQAILTAQPASAMASALRGMALREDTSSVLSSTNLPILILTGENDTLISPQQSQNMHALAKNSTLITIKNSGHLSSLEQSDQWSQAVITIFSTIKNKRS